MRLYFLIFGVVLFADQVTKYWIVTGFSLYEHRVIIPDFFNLVYVTNKGAAFSMFASVDSPLRHYFFVTINILAFIGLTIAAFKMRRLNKFYSLSFALVSSGAVGNVIDRIRMGAVVDFLDFYWGNYHWPAFNVADSAICVGVGILLVLNILEARK